MRKVQWLISALNAIARDSIFAIILFLVDVTLFDSHTTTRLFPSFPSPKKEENVQLYMFVILYNAFKS